MFFPSNIYSYFCFRLLCVSISILAASSLPPTAPSILPHPALPPSSLIPPVATSPSSLIPPTALSSTLLIPPSPSCRHPYFLLPILPFLLPFAIFSPSSFPPPSLLYLILFLIPIPFFPLLIPAYTPFCFSLLPFFMPQSPSLRTPLTLKFLNDNKIQR